MVSRGRYDMSIMCINVPSSKTSKYACACARLLDWNATLSWPNKVNSSKMPKWLICRLVNLFGLYGTLACLAWFLSLCTLSVSWKQMLTKSEVYAIGIQVECSVNVGRTLHLPADFKWQVPSDARYRKLAKP